MCDGKFKPWIWDDRIIISHNASLLRESLPQSLRGHVNRDNTELLVRVPPEEDTPQHQAFVVWCKEQNIVLSGFAGSVHETTTPLAA